MSMLTRPFQKRKRNSLTDHRKEVKALARILLKKEFRGDREDRKYSGLTKTQRKILANREALARVGRR